MTTKAQRLLTSLFEVFMNDIRLMPDDHQDNAVRLEDLHGDGGRAKAVADYVAGMTDRFAISEHARLFAIEEAHLKLSGPPLMLESRARCRRRKNAGFNFQIRRFLRASA